MKYFVLLMFLTFGCHREQIVSPTPKPDSDVCARMCQHIGPNGLNCDEGMPVYDSDKPGPKDVPNESCEEFCRITQQNGIPMNPRCVSLVRSCDQIEEARAKDVSSCN